MVDADIILVVCLIAISILAFPGFVLFTFNLLFKFILLVLVFVFCFLVVKKYK